MAARRALVVLIVLLTGIGLGALLVKVLAPGGWTLPKLAMLIAFIGTAPWTGLCLANGLIGFLILLLRGESRESVPLALASRTAIAVTIRNEDMRRVLPPLARLLDELDRSGSGEAFHLFILSDTQGSEA